MFCTSQTIRPLLFASVILASLSRVLSQWTNTHAVPNHVLTNHVIKSMTTARSVDCLQHCEDEAACYSINYYSSGVCELSDETKEKNTKDFHADSNGFYMQIRKVKDGLTPNTAASSCAELKRTNPGACSRPYWLDTNGDGSPTQQMCYMNYTHGVSSSCKVTTLSGKCCVFPFVYLGVTYNSCTDKRTNPKRQWCSLSAVYTGNWDRCVVQCPTCPTELGHCCAFPFEYDGKMFDSCTTYKEPTGRHWCSRTREYSTASKDFCV